MKTKTFTNTAMLNNMAKALEFGRLDSDQRVQIKMPSVLVQEIDRLYPQMDRSKYFSWLAINNIIIKNMDLVNDDMKDLLSSEQETLDNLSSYLDERESV